MTSPESTWPSKDERTLGGILRSRSRTMPDKTLLRHGDGSWTYREVDDWADRVAGGLQGLGLVKGDRLAVMLPNHADFVAVIFGGARLGIVQVPVNTAYKGLLLRHVIQQSQARAAIVAAEYLPRLAAIAAELPDLKTVVVWPLRPRDMPSLPFDLVSFEAVTVAGQHGSDPEMDPRDPLGIVYTSGTTGPSKGAVFSHNFFWWHAERARVLRGAADADCLYTCLPLFHTNAQMLTVVSALVTGATCALDDRFHASGFWDRMRFYGATQFNYIGGILPILLKQPPSARDRDHAVKVALGAAAPKDQWRAFEERFGVRLLEAYGQTEDGVATANTLDAVRVGSIGRAVWGFEMQVVDDDDRPVADDTIGEFVVRPEHPDIMMSGYFNMPDETLRTYRNLWFHTGDYGWRDADGYFYFHDRKKDAMRRRGENISAFEVEQVVNAHPAVLESAAYAIPSDVGEDDVMVAVVLKSGHTLEHLDLVRHCERLLPYFAVPRYVDIRADFPKTPTFRVEKYKLRQEGLTASTWDAQKAGYQVDRKA